MSVSYNVHAVFPLCPRRTGYFLHGSCSEPSSYKSRKVLASFLAVLLKPCRCEVCKSAYSRANTRRHTNPRIHLFCTSALFAALARRGRTEHIDICTKTPESGASHSSRQPYQGTNGQGGRDAALARTHLATSDSTLQGHHRHDGFSTELVAWVAETQRVHTFAAAAGPLTDNGGKTGGGEQRRA